MAILFYSGILAVTIVALLFVVLPLMKQKAYLMAITLALVLPVISLSLYFYWGDSQGLLQYFAHQQQAAQVKAELAVIKTPAQAIERLQAYLHEHPQGAKGWYLLGQLYLRTGDYPNAVSALNRAHQQSMENVDFSTAYAEALFFNNQRELTVEAENLLKEVLQRSPNNVAAINLLAIHAFNHGQYQRAIDYWEKLIPLFDPQSEDEKVLLQMISRAQRELHK